MPSNTALSTKLKSASNAIALALLGLTSACGGFGFGAATAPQAAAPLILVTAAPNASPTPTPFQPPLVEQATPTSLYNIQVPTLQPFLPTATASPTAVPPLEASPTVDLNSLFPTAAAPPLPAVSGDAPDPSALLTDTESINFLLIGSDKRPGGSYRTDTMVIVILWPREAQASMISIPRDLWVYIPSVGMQRINTAYQSGELYGYNGGGPGLLRDTIAYNLGIRIDHTAMVEFDGFRRIVDTLGGVDVPVACAFTDWHLIDPSYDPYNENNWALYTVEPGVAHMDGDLALWYARSRLRSSDFDRGRRQQEVLRALFGQALRTDSLARIPQLYTDLSETIMTDLGLGDILKLALYAPSLTNASIRSYYIRPPYVSAWMTPAGASVQLPNEAELEQMLIQATTLSSAAIERHQVAVEIQNGTGIPGLDGLAANRLNYAGYATHLSAADSTDYATSVVVDATDGGNAGQRETLLDILGLQFSSVISAPDANAGWDYRVVLGYDYETCFKPEDLVH